MKPRIVLTLCVLFIMSSNIIAGGWTQKANNYYLGLDYRIFTGSKYHNSDGDNVEFGKFVDNAFNLYGEYGITNDLTVTMNFPFYKMLNIEFDETSKAELDNSGVGDLDFGFRYKLYQLKKTVFSASVNFGLPLASTELEDISKLPLGDGEFNQSLGVEVGHSLYPMPAYASSSLKFNNRNEGYSDELFFSLEGGYKPVKNLLLNLRLSLRKSLNNGDKVVPDNVIPIFSNNVEYAAATLGVFYNAYKNLGVSATTNFGIYAKNILSAPVFSIGVYIK